MAEVQYKEHKAGKPKAPPIDLLEVTGERNLTVTLNAFGPDCFAQNVADMQKPYSHPDTGELIKLRGPTTAESVLAASYNFLSRAKPNILDPRWLQLGRIVRTSKGVYANPPRDAQGNSIISEQVLESFLKADKKVNGVWRLDNDFGYAPYETFKQGVQDAGDFAEGGLARVLEHTEKTAEKLKEIASVKDYSGGVGVFGFDLVSSPVLNVVSLVSYRSLGARRLHVIGWDDCGGFAFGVLDSAEGTRQKAGDK